MRKELANTTKIETAEEPKAPSIKFIVDDNDLIETVITVAIIKDSTGVYRPKPIRKDSLKTQKSIFLDRVKEIEETLSNMESDDLTRPKLNGELLAYKAVLEDLDDLLEAPSREFSAFWKRASWRDIAQINAESYVDDPSGAKQFSDEKNRAARIRYLLKDWNISEAGPNGREIKIPVHKHPQVDGEVVAAFINEYDRQLQLTKEEAGN